ncbi:MAG: hypothetical protein H6739_06185 [Alphaproteobacteria bacterium]|nr:hypothetical protein [Alphaproteobacteria bacterium]
MRARTLGLFLLGISGCIGSGRTDDTAITDDSNASVEPLPACHAADGRPLADIGVPSISGDVLTVDVTYGGGCEVHTYTLCWPDQAFMESEPVQVHLEILHESPEDACDAIITETPSFDLTPLKESWQAGYQQASGTIVIHLDGESVDYVF